MRFIVEKLLFIILCPFIFEFILFLINHFYFCWFDNIKQGIGLFISALCADYILETVAIIIIKKILGIWIFEKTFNDICGLDSTYIIPLLISSIFFVCLYLFLCEEFVEIPITYTIFLIAYLLLLFCTDIPRMHEYQDDYMFNSLNYQEEQYVVYIHAMGDGREVSGEVNGRSVFGTGWIHGKLETNYNLYYAFDDNGKVVMNSIPYNENNVNIYEIGDGEEPRIVFHKYSKLYSCKKGHDKYDEYYIYDIYISSISNSIKIDMD